MERLDLVTLVLAVTALWSITQLVTADTLTARPRRAVHDRLRWEAHAPTHAGVTSARCSCGWSVVMTRPDTEGLSWLIASDAPDSTAYRTGEASYPTACRDALIEHLTYDRVLHPGKVFELVSCPWCVSFWLGVPVVATAIAWGDGWGWQLVAAALGLRTLAGAAVVHLGPDVDAAPDPRDAEADARAEVVDVQDTALSAPLAATADAYEHTPDELEALGRARPRTD